MRSSTSSSDRSLKLATWALLGGVVAMLIGAEMLTRVFFDRVSRVQRRMAAEWRGARQAGRSDVLVLGNSLLLDGVDFPRFRAAVAGTYTARRFAVENTSYLDWYYGMRRIFREGARPRMVLLALSPQQFAAASSRGEYSSYYLFSAPDLLDGVSSLELHPTPASNFLVAHFSQFYGVRSEIRKFVLLHAMPSFPGLAALFHGRGVPLDLARLRDVAGRRLRECSELAASYGSEFLLVSMPVAGDAESQTLLSQEGQRTGVRTLRPFQAGEYSADDFADGLHLRAAVGIRFADHLAADVLQLPAR